MKIKFEEPKEEMTEKKKVIVKMKVPFEAKKEEEGEDNEKGVRGRGRNVAEK